MLVQDQSVPLSGAPNQVQIDARLREIHVLVTNGRMAKGRNRWDELWEAGVIDFTAAFDRLKSLHSELEAYWFRFEQARANTEQAKVNERHTRLHLWGIGIGVGGLVLGLAIDYLAHHFGWW